MSAQTRTASYPARPRAPSDQPRDDGLLYLFLAAALLCLPMVIQDTEWFPEPARLYWPVIWAGLLGAVLARTRFPTWLCWLLSLILGAEYSVQFAGRLLPGLDLLVDDTVLAVRWLFSFAGLTSSAGTLPYQRSALILLERSASLVQDTSLWFQAVQSGSETRILSPMLLGVYFLVWILSFNAAFALLRSRKPFSALLPLGTAVIANVSFTDIGMRYVQVFLGITLFTLVRANAQRMERFWARLGLDFSPELRRDATLAGGALAIVVLVIALLIPYMTYNDAVWLFWDNLGPRFEAFYDDLDRAFAGRNPVPSPTPGKGRGLTAHDIGGQGALGEDVVLLIETTDPAPLIDEELEMLAGFDPAMNVTKRYWRERTYGAYTGYGWDVGQPEALTLNAGDAWTSIDYPHETLTQTVQVVASNAGLGFAVNEPLRIVDVDYQAITRGPGDLAALQLADDTYTVVSLAPDPSAKELDAAEGPFPDWVRERYMSLPRTLPERVRREAERVIVEAGATTRYEKARAIETYLRAYEYDADLEPPPLDADFVDYFLFEAQRGYCDYSATAMVVMLRSVGVAARYASGYNMGDYDMGLDRWVVRERNAHAWAEVYFPGLGWIEFEPTPTEYIFARQGFDALGTNLPTVQPDEGATRRMPLWGWGLVVALVIAFVVVWPPRWFRRERPEPRQMVWGIYARLVQRARWAGLAPMEGQTPREYLSALAAEMERRVAFQGAAADDVHIVERTYARARYSNRDIPAADAMQVLGAWKRLRGKLLRLAFVRPPSHKERSL